MMLRFHLYKDIFYRSAKISFLPCLFFIVAGCSDKNISSGTSKIQETDSLVAKYKGALPCADCSALKVELLLFKNGHFTEINTYENAPGGNKTYRSKGDWTIQLHKSEREQDSLLVLHYPKTNSFRYYLKTGPLKIEMLNSQKKRIHSPFDQSLRLAQPSKR